MNGKRFIQWASGLLGLVGMIYLGAIYFEDRYAKSADVNQKIATIQQTIQEGQLEDLYRERLQLKLKEEKGPLTTLERSRLDQVERKIRELEKKLEKGG